MPLIALDAMGGDHAPSETVAGAIEAVDRGVDVVLVGDSERVTEELEAAGRPIPVLHAPQSIEMGEDPARAIREKPDSSVVACARLVKSGEAAGFVSAGSTGAAMAAAAIVVGRVPGVLRPTIASILPKPNGSTVVLDSGANPEVKPEHLVQFAEMGSALAQVYLDKARPRVGLLSIGHERGKGRALERATYDLLETVGLEFIGNVEGRDLAADDIDVIVTDGFTGNVLLKTAEGIAAMVAKMAMGVLAETPPEVQSSVMPALAPLRAQLDYENTGGAHLLGTDGVVVIAHGSSSRRSILNALLMAREGAERELVAKVAALITET